MEDFVTFDLAKKLMEIGTTFPTKSYYDSDKMPIYSKFSNRGYIPRPTISQVLKWLREEKKIHIQVLFACPPNRWEYVTIRTTNCEMRGMQASFISYELAAIAGIEYVLDNLI